MQSQNQTDTTPAYFKKFQALCEKLGNAGINPEEYSSFNTLQWHMAEFRMQCDEKEFKDAAEMLITDFPKDFNNLKLDISKQHTSPGTAIKIIDDFLPQLEQMKKSLSNTLQKQQTPQETKTNSPASKP